MSPSQLELDILFIWGVYELSKTLHQADYSGFRVDGTGTQRYPLYWGQGNNPPLGDCAIGPLNPL